MRYTTFEKPMAKRVMTFLERDPILTDNLAWIRS